MVIIIKATLRLQVAANNYTIDLSKRLKSTDANRYVKTLKLHTSKSSLKNLANIEIEVNRNKHNVYIDAVHF